MIRDIRENCPEELETLREICRQGIARRDSISCSSARFSASLYGEAVELLKKSGEKFEFPVEYGLNLQSEHERWLTEKHFKCPVTVFNYPKEIKPFYMRLNDDNKTVTAMDLLVPGIGEIVGGSQREERLEVLEENMRRHKMDPADYKWYLDLRRYGTVPAFRLRSRLRTHAHVRDRRRKHSRRHSLRPHARECGVLMTPFLCHVERSRDISYCS